MVVGGGVEDYGGEFELDDGLKERGRVAAGVALTVEIGN